MQTLCLAQNTNLFSNFLLEMGKNANPVRTNRTRTFVLPGTEPNTKVKNVQEPNRTEETLKEPNRRDPLKNPNPNVTFLFGSFTE